MIRLIHKVISDALEMLEREEQALMKRVVQLLGRFFIGASLLGFLPASESADQSAGEGCGRE